MSVLKIINSIKKTDFTISGDGEVGCGAPKTYHLVFPKKGRYEYVSVVVGSRLSEIDVSTNNSSTINGDTHKKFVVDGVQYSGHYNLGTETRFVFDIKEDNTEVSITLNPKNTLTEDRNYAYHVGECQPHDDSVDVYSEERYISLGLGGEFMEHLYTMYSWLSTHRDGGNIIY